MKYLKKFNEAIISPDHEKIDKFIVELKAKVNEKGYLPFSEVNKIAEKYGMDCVSYDQFYSDLSEQNKKTAPPKKGSPIFALLNPSTNMPRLVYCVPEIRYQMIDMVRHMMEHETIHVGQSKRMNIDDNGVLPSPIDKKGYFSDKREIMAFSQSITDMILNIVRPRTMDEAIKALDRNPLYLDIKKEVDNIVLQRYKKYIYLYFEKHFKPKELE